MIQGLLAAFQYEVESDLEYMLKIQSALKYQNAISCTTFITSSDDQSGH
jgi:hypothetical protein